MVMAQVGVRTRARAALAMEATSSLPPTVKRRKINRAENRKFSTVQPKTVTVRPVPETEKNSSDEDSPASCCSSNGSVGLDEERIKSLDLEVESAQGETSTCNCDEEIERREMSRSSEFRGNSHELESMETDSHRPISSAKNTPTDFELEEFFAAAEKDIQKKFQQKYNYDILKDVPMEGRYEWVQLKP
ncbi:cyclin-dependent kinase inhibitor 7-like [Vicia villosa]|uniref:cyclin-dependent kinase inhibitor 7-like n=1 Tax=Vicia villosa TaxID=3911 RepID=UPI00273CEAE5|nr:cyclin-dependent kinase inhibitor 7-like [Vicia villosa]